MCLNVDDISIAPATPPTSVIVLTGLLDMILLRIFGSFLDLSALVTMSLMGSSLTDFPIEAIIVFISLGINKRILTIAGSSLPCLRTSSRTVPSWKIENDERSSPS